VSNYICGDIHGCFDLLELELDKIGFNRSVDHLYTTGDIIDRGPNSESCLDYLNEDWFHSILGNHEDMFLQVHYGTWNAENYVYNGGSWAFRLKNNVDYIKAFEALPLTRLVGDIGIVHSKIPKGIPFRQAHEISRKQILWSRDWNKVSYITEGASSIYIGHTIVDQPYIEGNYKFMDTGAMLSNYADLQGYLTIEPMVNFTTIG